MDEDVGESALVDLFERFSHRADRRLSHEYVHVRIGRRPDHALQQQQVCHIRVYTRIVRPHKLSCLPSSYYLQTVSHHLENTSYLSASLPV